MVLFDIRVVELAAKLEEDVFHRAIVQRVEFVSRYREREPFVDYLSAIVGVEVQKVPHALNSDYVQFVVALFFDSQIVIFRPPT